MVLWNLLALLSNCMDYLASIDFRVSHILREGNGVDDILSKMALESNEDHWSFQLPNSCFAAHASDLWGIEVSSFLSLLGVGLFLPGTLFSSVGFPVWVFFNMEF